MTDAHTFVIPTFNRAAFVQRLVRYYRKRAPSSDLLVLDSSRPEVVRENAQALSSWGAAVRHIEFPEDLPPLTKLARGLEVVETPYASFCADDDVVFPGAIAQSVEFLERSPEYASAHGLYLNFRQDGNAIHVLNEYSGPGIEASHPGARIFRLMQRYESLFYGVFRTKDLRNIIFAAQALPSTHFVELFQSVAAVIKGKVKRFPYFYAARQSGPPAEPKRERWQTYYWFADNPAEMLEHYQGYCAELWKFYEEHSPEPRLEKAEFLRTLHLSHGVYFSAGCPPEYFHAALQSNWGGEPYRDPRSVDLFAEQSFPRFLAKPNLTRLAVLAGYGIGAVWAAPFLALMNLGTRWRYRLPASRRWLATIPGFRSACLEIRNLLDQP